MAIIFWSIGLVVQNCKELTDPPVYLFFGNGLCKNASGIRKTSGMIWRSLGLEQQLNFKIANT